MHDILKSGSPLIQWLGKFADLLVLNILTILLSLPILTIGAAVTALYDASWRIVEDEGNIYLSFFQSFATNFKKATLIWICVISTGLLLCVASYYYEAKASLFFSVMTYMAWLLWAVTTAWLFPLQSRFENPILITVKNAFLCAMGHLPRSLIMAALNVFPWVMLLFFTSTWVQLSMVWILIWFSMTAFLNCTLLRKPIRKFVGIIMPQE